LATLTLAQFVDVVRNRHNAVGDSNWSDAEIYALLTQRLNEAMSYTGLIEATATASTVIATQEYAYPTGCQSLVAVDYNSQRLRKIDFTEWDMYRSASTGTPQGTPTAYFPFNDYVYLIPTPSAVGTIKYWYLKDHTFIDGSVQTTIDVASILIPHITNGVLSDMYAKDLNQGMATFYENMWVSKGIPAFYQYRALRNQASDFTHIKNSDTEGNHGDYF
jgi:hypothetical protein